MLYYVNSIYCNSYLCIVVSYWLCQAGSPIHFWVIWQRKNYLLILHVHCLNGLRLGCVRCDNLICSEKCVNILCSRWWLLLSVLLLMNLMTIGSENLFYVCVGVGALWQTLYSDVSFCRGTQRAFPHIWRDWKYKREDRS